MSAEPAAWMHRIEKPTSAKSSEADRACDRLRQDATAPWGAKVSTECNLTRPQSLQFDHSFYNTKSPDSHMFGLAKSVQSASEKNSESILVSVLKSHASAQEKIKATEQAWADGVKTIHIPDQDGQNREYQLSVEKIGGSGRAMVHLFTEDGGSKHVVLRGIEDSRDHSVKHEVDTHGKVGLYGDYVSKNMKDRIAVSIEEADARASSIRENTPKSKLDRATDNVRKDGENPMERVVSDVVSGVESAFSNLGKMATEFFLGPGNDRQRTIKHEFREPLIREALKLAGAAVNEANIRAVELMVNGESGWKYNPPDCKDYNWRRGYPSKGLMQAIPQTFQAHRRHDLPNEINHPLANMVACIHYALKRYDRHNFRGGDWGHNYEGDGNGSLANVPGVRAAKHHGRYRGY